ncbi:MAG: cellulose biosynthesis cyclic di-GMP-binding regulatory protein BcsB [Vampirovibrionales bacterium]|nr:cellulose biosynthesis cyclic di-GMP-binding regulatory protein BcsB [Vampirovibrionales bacterium]
MKRLNLAMMLAGTLLVSPVVPLMQPLLLPAAQAQAKSVAQPHPEAKPAEAPSAQPSNLSLAPQANRFTQTLKAYGNGLNEQGRTLKTVRSEYTMNFMRSDAWQVLPSSAVKLAFQHSPQLLEGRSSLNVLLNGRVLKTIPLNKGNVAPTTLSIPIPPSVLKPENTLSFQVDQHYTNDCEDPFSPELWTTLLPETQLDLNFAPKPFVADLARLPFPFIDTRDARPAQLGVSIDAKSDADSLTALGQTLTTLGAAQHWRPGHTHMLTPDTALAFDGNLVLVGTPQNNPAIAQFKLPADVKLNKNDGLLMLAPNPKYTGRGVLIVTGESPEGVAKAAKLFATLPGRQLLSGPYAVVTDADWPKNLPNAYRNWPGYQSDVKTTFADMGWETQTARGFTAPPIFYKWQIMPDLFVPNRGQQGSKANLKLVYSYSSQLDASQSKLEILLNGKSIKSVPLNKPEGAMQEELAVTIPTGDVLNYNDLVFQFYTFPEKVDTCKFVTDVHVWGTIHNSSILQIPAEVRTPMPDLGLLNDGGFPFTAFNNLSEALIVLPDAPSQTDLQVLASVSNRLGRQLQGAKTHQLKVVKASELSDADRSRHHLILIGTPDENALTKRLKGRFHLLVGSDGQTGLTEKDEASLQTMRLDQNQGLLEAMRSPWNKSRELVVVTGHDADALAAAGQVFEDEALFNQLGSGNLAVVRQFSNGQYKVQTATHIKKDETGFVYENELGPKSASSGWPLWTVVLAGFFAIVGVISTIRLLLKR